LTTPRAKILHDAAALIQGERQSDYGPPEKNFADIAAMWSVILDQNITPYQVTICMAALKICRAKHGHHEDSLKDAAGYLGIGHEVGDG